MSYSEWKYYLIEDIAESIFSGGTPSTKNKGYWDGEYPWLSSGETRNSFITKTEKSITKEGINNSSTKLAMKNDVVIASAGQGYTRGQVSFCEIDTYINQSIVCIRSNRKKVEPLFLFYNLKNRYNELRQLSDGHSIRGSLTTKIIKKLDILLPQLDEQRRIVNLLYSIDKKIEINNLINETLEEIGETIFKNWFVDYEFPDNNGKPYKSSGGKLVESELGMLPEEWKVGTIDEIGTVIGGGTPSKKRDDYYTDNGIPWITPKDLSNNTYRYISKGAIDITEEGYKNSSVKLLPKGTVLFSSRAPIGYIAIAKNEVTTNQGFKSIIPNENIGTEFVFQLLKYKKNYIENISTGSTFKEISGGQLKKIPIIIPKDSILEQFKKVTSSIGELIKNTEGQNETLINIRNILLPKLMSGEIRIPEVEEAVESCLQKNN